jgi:16S rRNA (uracil1498-N3)-methyltransferase
MRIPRVYAPQPLQPGQTVSLTPAAAHHVGRVLRLEAGAPLLLFNGEGGEYEAYIIASDRAGVRAMVEHHRPVERESPLRITLLQGISRGERMDYTLQKATELGIHRIVPIQCERTGVRLDAARATKRGEHWRGILISACEQSGRDHLPELAPPQALAQAIASLTGTPALRLLLDPRGQHGLRELAAQTQIVLLAGPEGGLTPAEMDAAAAEGFQGIRLGPRILRTETAAVVMLAALQALWGDFS